MSLKRDALQRPGVMPKARLCLSLKALKALNEMARACARVQTQMLNASAESPRWNELRGMRLPASAGEICRAFSAPP